MQISAKLQAVAASCNMEIRHKPTRFVRGWPQASLKPWGIYYDDGSHLASFATIAALELNLRGRCGC